jgi:hypothetical protein
VVAEASRSIAKHPPCAGIRKDGRRCAAPGLLDSYCYSHSPDKAAERDAARRKGGRGKARTARLEKLVPASLRPAIGVLFVALEEVHDGDLTPAQGQAMAAIAGAIGRLYQTGVLEERLAALEAAYGQDEGRRRAW